LEPIQIALAGSPGEQRVDVGASVGQSNRVFEAKTPSGVQIEHSARHWRIARSRRAL
jgi:hypothetical protein